MRDEDQVLNLLHSVRQLDDASMDGLPLPEHSSLMESEPSDRLVVAEGLEREADEHPEEMHEKEKCHGGIELRHRSVDVQSQGALPQPPVDEASDIGSSDYVSSSTEDED